MFLKKITGLSVIMFLILFTAASSEGRRGGDNTRRPQNTRPIISNVPAGGHGLIRPCQQVFYPGDTICISYVLPRNLRGVWSGEAVPHLVVRDPEGTLTSQPLPVQEHGRNHFEFVLEEGLLTPGFYQLALVLTGPDGDPLLLSDWYGSFRGLITVTRVKVVNGEAGSDPDDTDGNGQIDGDDDGDGHDDDEEDENGETEEEIDEDSDDDEETETS